MTKLCKDCRHSEYQRALLSEGLEEARRRLKPRMACALPSGPADLVTGHLYFDSCEFQRYAIGGQCGKSGKLWEAPDAQDS